MTRYLFLLLVPFLMGAYSYPIGVPSAWIDPNTIAPTYPWSDKTTDHTVYAGKYFVKYNGGSDSTECNSGGVYYGCPAHPRQSIPSPIPAGSYIYITGTHATQQDVQSQGTSGSPVWIMGDATFTRRLLIYGSYAYIDGSDGMTWTGTTGDSCIKVSSENAGTGYSADHILIRSLAITGDGTMASAMTGIIAVGNSSNTSSNIIIYDVEVTDVGAMDNRISTYENVAIAASQYVTNMWMLENTTENFFHTTIFAGGQYGSPAADTTNIYISKNSITNSNVAGIALKCSEHVVISENTIDTVADKAWSPGKCMGFQYALDNIWVVNNSCKSSLNGFRVGSTDAGTSGSTSLFFIGNVISDIDWRDHCWYAEEDAATIATCTSSGVPSACCTGLGTGTCKADTCMYGASWSAASGGYYEMLTESFSPVSTYQNAGLTLAGGNKVYAVNNTIYSTTHGITLTDSGYVFVLLENNIVYSINDAAGVPYWMASTANVHARNNSMYDIGTYNIKWGSTAYSSVSAWQTAVNDAHIASGNSSSDPLLVSSSNFRLQSSSPAIGAGLAPCSGATCGTTGYLSAVSGQTVDVYTYFPNSNGSTWNGLSILKDIAGTSRPQVTWDIGAYEYTTGGSGGTATIGAGGTIGLGAGGTITLQ